MNLAEVIKNRRKTLAISQQDLAEMAGIGLATIKDIERGKGNPSMATVSKIMEVLGMDIIYKVHKTV
ncbi:MAG: helix-turn-helix transcriptional regulator [Bacteroidales bacterium]|nr:helix-turn-helix transcriptional regulator [Bacteroidales bacterium]